MATTASAFFGDQASGSELSALLKNIPNGFKGFTSLKTGSPGKDAFVGTKKSEIFVLGDNDRVASAGAGYDAVVTDRSITLSSKSGIEAVKLTGATNAKVTGNAENNNIVGNAGNNTLNGGAGNDVVVGGAGNDKILGGKGNDSLFGGDGNDKIFGDVGNDKLYGGKGNDTLDAGAGNDRVFGEDGNDLLKGMSGDDKLFGGAGNDTLLGGAGKDTLVGGDGADTLRGNAGNDVFKMTKQASDVVDIIADFKVGEDIIDLGATGTKKFSELKIESDKSGGSIVTAKDGTTFKLVGYDPDEVKASFFDF